MDFAVLTTLVALTSVVRAEPVREGASAYGDWAQRRSGSGEAYNRS